MELYTKVVNDWKSLTILANSSILDICLDPKYAFVLAVSNFDS